ncbi:MAG: glycine--tRNA ligase [Candidatus Hydrogenedentota bacterium]
MYFQDVLQTLNRFWSEKGCMLWQPYHTEVGAGTSNPATFLRVLGPEPWWVSYMEPSMRPADGRYAENPNRMQHYFQYQVILKPSPPNVQELFLQSMEALGLDLTMHDFRFVEDNWQSPSLGAWGLGWESWLDGMEVLQFTYFQECGGVKLDVRACELTYGVERICMYLQGVESVYDLKWAPGGVTYGDIYKPSEIEFCKYNFESADTGKLLTVFDIWENEGLRLIGEGLVLPAYDHCLRLSHLFNVLDARGAFSVTERGRFLLRCRTLSEQCAKAFAAQRSDLGYPLLKYPLPCSLESQRPDYGKTQYRDRDTLLLEIGVEELPHKDITAVREQALPLFKKLFEQKGIEHGDIRLLVSPRRIAFLVDSVPARQPDIEKEARGPKKAQAVTAQGEWTIAAQKFAEGQGGTVADIYFATQGSDEYCFVKVSQKGKALPDLLATVVDDFLKQIRFDKTMGWEDSTVSFSRPVRWIVALHGENVVPVSWQMAQESPLGGERVLHSGRVTYGHRRLGSRQAEVASANAYVETLREGFVLVDREERMEQLRSRVLALANSEGLTADDDTSLYEEICDLGEWPEPILGEIPHEALELPESIIITPMKVHQRYIPLRKPDGTLSPLFICVANGEHSDAGRHVIKSGNERVLNARLRDAKYFWDTDTKKPLREFAAGLGNLLFHQKLGTVADKIARLKRLYEHVSAMLPKVEGWAFSETLDLMKADLTTQMVFEFDSLEGEVGMLYARKEGLPDDIAAAIFEHRLPRFAGDSLPSGPLGFAAGLLDRVDTLAGYFGIGIRPKGSSDPFGLRRNALSLIALCRGAERVIDLEVFFKAALANYGGVADQSDDTLRAILEFIADRQTVALRDEGRPYDLVQAAVAAHGRRPILAVQCADALSALPADALQELAEQAKRMQRIVKEPAESVNKSMLDKSEAGLYALLTKDVPAVAALMEKQDFAKAVQTVLAWTPAIAAYFVDVMVNDKDVAIRQNRHALIKGVFDGLSAVADFTRIEKRK